MPAAHGIGRQGGGKCVQDVGPVHAVEAVPAAGIGHHDGANFRAVHPAIGRACADFRADLCQRLLEAHAFHLPQAVGIDENARADFSQCGGLFIHGDVYALLQQRVGRGQAAHAAADNDGPQLVRFG